MESVLEKVISFASPLGASLGSVLGASLSVAILGGIFAGMLAYALFFGKKVMVSSLFSLIFAGFLFAVFPYRDMLTASLGDGNYYGELFTKGGIFAALFLLSFFAIRQNIRGSGYVHEGTRKLLNALALALAAGGVLSVYAYQFTPWKDLYPISSSFLAPLIMSPSAPFWWLAGAFLAVYLFSE